MQRLFRSIQLNSLQVKNRIMMPAMHLGYAKKGYVTERLIRFYQARAKGGVGFIVIGACAIDVPHCQTVLRLDQDEYIPGLQQLVEVVKEQKTPIVAQLSQGIYGLGEEIETINWDEIVSLYVEAAVRAQKAGFDGVEILGSELFKESGNWRYHMSIAMRIITSIKSKLRNQFSVFFQVDGYYVFRYLVWEQIFWACDTLKKAGVDAIRVSSHWNEMGGMSVPHASDVYLSSIIKKVSDIPVILCNRINDPQMAESLLQSGVADMVGMARGLLADPDLPIKAEENRLQEIRHCIGCNQGCFDALQSGKAVSCVVNVQAGKELEPSSDLAYKPKKVLVIGGGPAGMEAARSAACRGHQVTLWEKADNLGGQLNLAAAPPRRKEYLTMIRDLELELQRLGVDIVLQKEATEENVLAFQADAIIAATGSTPASLAVPGENESHVVQARDVLAGIKQTGTQVVIIGGGIVGCETARLLATQGALTPEVMHFLILQRQENIEKVLKLATQGLKQVTILEKKSDIGLSFGQSNRQSVIQELEQFGVTIVTGALVEEITPTGVQYQKDGQLETIVADTVVLAVGAHPDSQLCEELKEKVKEVYMVGDAVSPGKLQNAMIDACLAGDIL